MLRNITKKYKVNGSSVSLKSKVSHYLPEIQDEDDDDFMTHKYCFYVADIFR